jgi:hypothetical protein
MITKTLSALFIAGIIFFSGAFLCDISMGGTIANATTSMNCEYDYRLPQYTVTDEKVKEFLQIMTTQGFGVTGIAIDKYVDYIIWFEDNKGCGAVFLSPRRNLIRVVGQRHAIEVFKQGLRDGDYNDA